MKTPYSGKLAENVCDELPGASTVTVRCVSQDFEPGGDPYNSADKLTKQRANEALFDELIREDDLSTTIRAAIVAHRENDR